jgi:hypothetical protein
VHQDTEVPEFVQDIRLRLIQLNKDEKKVVAKIKEKKKFEELSQKGRRDFVVDKYCKTLVIVIISKGQI